MKNYNSRFHWHEAVDDTVCKALAKCYPRDWKDEDYLTRSLLAALKNEHSNVTIEKDKVTGKNTKCHWDIYKNTKEQGIEQKHGDIGILVQLRFDDTKILEGVAFLEAKRIYHEKDDSKSKFQALDKSQLERYCNHSSFHRTVFYDYIKTKSGDFEAKSLTLPTRHLLVLDKNSRDIYPYCEYLSYCLTNRYFQGYELDFDPDLVNSVKGFLGANGGVKYLIVAQSTLSPEIELNPELIKINRDIYETINDPKPDIKPNNNFSPSM